MAHTYCMHTHIYIYMRQAYKKGNFLYLFLIVKFTNAKIQNILRCSVMDEWRKNVAYIPGGILFIYRKEWYLIFYTKLNEAGGSLY